MTPLITFPAVQFTMTVNGIPYAIEFTRGLIYTEGQDCSVMLVDHTHRKVFVSDETETRSLSRLMTEVVEECLRETAAAKSPGKEQVHDEDINHPTIARRRQSAANGDCHGGTFQGSRRIVDRHEIERQR